MSEYLINTPDELIIPILKKPLDLASLNRGVIVDMQRLLSKGNIPVGFLSEQINNTTYLRPYAQLPSSNRHPTLRNLEDLTENRPMFPLPIIFGFGEQVLTSDFMSLIESINETGLSAENKLMDSRIGFINKLLLTRKGVPSLLANEYRFPKYTFLAYSFLQRDSQQNTALSIGDLDNNQGFSLSMNITHTPPADIKLIVSLPDSLDIDNVTNDVSYYKNTLPAANLNTIFYHQGVFYT